MVDDIGIRGSAPITNCREVTPDGNFDFLPLNSKHLFTPTGRRKNDCKIRSQEPGPLGSDSPLHPGSSQLLHDQSRDAS